jgi:hypothetical protein
MKIYLACFPASNWGKDNVIGYAIAENGEGLASHLSSNIAFSKHDMGLTSNWKHDHYTKCFPEGYDLIWIDNPDSDERWLKAVELNKTQKTKHDEEMSSVKVTISEDTEEKK